MRPILGLAIFLSSLIYSERTSFTHFCLSSSNGAVLYTVEVVDNVISRSIGLMYREPLSPKSGMLFLYSDETNVTFWMKNVAFSLDILFIDASGKVIKIHENAMPNDLVGVHSGANVIAVLEIRGGTTKRAHFEKGMVIDIDVLHRRQTMNCPQELHPFEDGIPAIQYGD